MLQTLIMIKHMKLGRLDLTLDLQVWLIKISLEDVNKLCKLQ